MSTAASEITNMRQAQLCAALAMTFIAFALGGCTVVSVASSAVGATVAVGSAAVGAATTVVSGTVKAGGAVVGAVTP